ncbi:hypothetical protein [Pseudoponticoccus marisrubri]|uniref:Uncharacterized protein n=1 Tax=Pseudoponticoccus marisrubri TaxID=1685382 RepID=A0A0W7WDL6_9RHOB|nr:hypothetical protein [Pseudoponticoccus marisrubri]KUF08626.1 hypothetical protein AVJ23_21855 [Pseudoponticoccus marisrubri]
MGLLSHVEEATMNHLTLMLYASTYIMLALNELFKTELHDTMKVVLYFTITVVVAFGHQGDE